MRWLTLLAVLALTCVVSGRDRGLPEGVVDTQNPRDKPLSPRDAVKRFKLPQGFRVTLFAGEPDVCQPIGMAFDDRGRLWVAECFSYPQWTAPEQGRDRIVIFEDSDGDGVFDRRTVFWDRAYNLSGLTLGHGGVWACCAPHLLFIPVKAGQDKPAGKPEVVLEGWTLKAGHNIYNGLTWGPDGWLWGRHGITAESKVGKPGTPENQRVALNCSIWRYHPTRKVFEVVCNGTTNPWGLDFDDFGEPFFTNCVIGHLWHAIPGARFKRMYGQDYNRHAYELIDSTSDHLHWAGGHWTGSRDGKGAHDQAGGGHAHCGTMIYLGDNWPDSYRGHVYTCNIHGRRLNADRLEVQGCGYVGKRGFDLFHNDDPWHRGVALDYGPDGSVFVLDWCDLGECHDNDGVHRSSGRIYRFRHGADARLPAFDLQKKSDAELVALQLHKNDWWVRHARGILAERAGAGQKMDVVHRQLRQMLEQNPAVTRKLRALWCLQVTGGLDEKDLLGLLEHREERLRVWAVRLLCDGQKLSETAREKFEKMAAREPSGLVRSYLASALHRLPPRQRFALAGALATQEKDASDRTQPLMIWYGLEPAVPLDPAASLALAGTTPMAKLRQFIARRLAETENHLDLLIAAVARGKTPPIQEQLLEGIRDGLKGRKQVKAPPRWREVYALLTTSKSPAVRNLARVLALTFDDPQARKELLALVRDTGAGTDDRVSAMQALVNAGVAELGDILRLTVREKVLRSASLRALAAYPSDDLPRLILSLYPELSDAEKQDAIATLASRPAFALALLEAVEAKKLPRSDITSFTARQIQNFKDRALQARLERVWGTVRQSQAEKKKLIEEWKSRLTPTVLARANLSSGRALFNKHCAQCHTLFGEGGKIGPDLTGSDRGNLHYFLENVIDPNAVVPGDYRLTNVTTKRGRLISGLVVEETDRALTIQTATEKLIVAKSDIEERKQSNLSMMPEGVIEKMSLEEVRDLAAYLASKTQVPLPR